MRSSFTFSFVSTLLPLVALAGGCDSAGTPLPPPDDPVESHDQPGADGALKAAVQRVLVINTNTAPVLTQAVGPTTVTGAVVATQSGAWDVSVAGGTVGASQAGAWSVSATQAGPWSVGATQQGPWSVDLASAPPIALAPGSSVNVGSVGAVGSLPPVTIAGTPAVTIANSPNVAVSGVVAIANTEDDEAVPVRVVGGDSGGGVGGGGERTPWVVSGQVIIDPGETFESEQLATPPLGKYIVIEQISVSGSLPTDQVVTEVTLLGSAVGAAATMRWIANPWPKTHPSFDRFGMNEHVAVNIRDGAGVIVAVARGNATTGTGVFNVALSGYLADAPAP